MEPRIRILMVEDELIVRKALSALLALEENILVVGEAGYGKEALAQVKALAPDVMLLDLNLPDCHGLDIIRALAYSGSSTRILVLTASTDDKILKEVLSAGAIGYLLKTHGVTDLLPAIEQAYHKRPFRALPKPDIPTRNSPLTASEQRVLAQLALGSTNKEIATALGVSSATVRVHLRNICGKFQVESGTQAVLYALRKGLIPEHRVNENKLFRHWLLP